LTVFPTRPAKRLFFPIPGAQVPNMLPQDRFPASNMTSQVPILTAPGPDSDPSRPQKMTSQDR